MEKRSIDQKELVKKQFSQNAIAYVNSQSHAKGKDLDLLAGMIAPQTDWLALDIATGGGHLTKFLSPLVNHVYTTDFTKKMLEEAKKHLQKNCSNISYVIADAEELPFLDDQFDFVGCRIAAHHFPDKQAFVQQVSRVLKPSGVFLLIDNVVPNDTEIAQYINEIECMRDKSHVECLSIDDWKELASESGLTIWKEEKRKKTFDFPVWVKRTTESEEQIRQVEEFIQAGTKEQQQYIHLIQENRKIQSIQIDEWIAVFKRST
ncbi:class I SAM-dependent methyltransferase [Terribacillus saccharophilus]|uniref:class I SAM-dependent methyltransferase n=1 Tax=Terribacillus saccharophilus TaxID=361277 RepID=UPI003981F205